MNKRMFLVTIQTTEDYGDYTDDDVHDALLAELELDCEKEEYAQVRELDLQAIS